MFNRDKNIVMFPRMEQGHIIPFVALAHRIQQISDTYTITFVTTPLNINKMKSYLPPNSSNISLVEIPFSGTDYGLPPHSENTNVLPYRLIPNFLNATLSLKTPFRKLISEQHGHPPLCIIADNFLAWCADVAREYGVFSALFCGGGGFGFACFCSLWINLPHRLSNTAKSDEITLPDFPEVSSIHVTQLSEPIRVTDGKDLSSKFHEEVLAQWSKADGILFNTVEDLDKTGLTYFRRKFGKSVWSVGPVKLSYDNSSGARKEAGISSDMCIEWLDTKSTKSVLYVSFGSQNTISTSQMTELALALETSCKNFIWVVRPPLGFDINSEFRAEEWLPDGFEAVCAFLSHCGWNSVMEALGGGVPILGWPVGAEQFYNAKLLEEEVGVCVEVARGRSVVRHEDLVAKIELVMNGTDRGIEIARKACQVREMIKNAMKDEVGFKGLL